MADVTNVRRVQSLLRNFYSEESDGATIVMEDPPLGFSTADRDELKAVRQYSKGSLALLSQAVQERATHILETALQHTNDTNTINDKVVQKMEKNLYRINR